MKATVQLLASFIGRVTARARASGDEGWRCTMRAPACTPDEPISTALDD